MEINVSKKEENRLISVRTRRPQVLTLQDSESSLLPNAPRTSNSSIVEETASLRSVPVFVVVLVVLELIVGLALWLSSGYEIGELKFLQLSVVEYCFSCSLFDEVCTR